MYLSTVLGIIQRVSKKVHCAVRGRRWKSVVGKEGMGGHWDWGQFIVK